MRFINDVSADEQVARASALACAARCSGAVVCEQVNSATAYCERCKKTTWLCSTPAHVSSATLNEAVVEFHYNIQRAKAVGDALAIAHKYNGA